MFASKVKFDCCNLVAFSIRMCVIVTCWIKLPTKNFSHAVICNCCLLTLTKLSCLCCITIYEAIRMDTHVEDPYDGCSRRCVDCLRTGATQDLLSRVRRRGLLPTNAFIRSRAITSVTRNNHHSLVFGKMNVNFYAFSTPRGPFPVK